MNMIEKVAIAIQNALSTNDVELATIVAKAAIAVMREPSEGMIDAHEFSNHLGGLEQYQAMIDAALKEE